MNENALEKIREKINAIDSNILDLLKQRAYLATEVAQVKKQQKNPVFYRPEREAVILRNIVANNQSLLPDEEVARIFRDIMTACLALQQPLNIAYLGPEGTFCQQAVEKQFGTSVNLLSESSITEVFRQVESNNAHYGVVPMENSTEGIVNITLDNLMSSNLQICGEIVLPIHHYLARINPDKPLNCIYGHQQAIAQCRHWLTKHYPQVSLKEVASNAVAAQMAAQEEGSAAICSDRAVQLYQLQVIKGYIEDHPNNTTRFIILGKQIPEPSGLDKTSLIISTPHTPGSLLHLLAPFEKHHINLTMIESRPYRHRNWSYLFFIDFEGHQADVSVQEVLNELTSMSVMMTLLGSYPQATG